ncbi:hypothetical protein JCM19302_1908 [Jejuia pallidilutea]|uniref:Uncharacterized protein n=1 Tax=Jejuia pallidilutea TaxID=504487 RepID=A0A090W678_9FLAO|nr:hypothetical protein JCM19302_1908 [Jejuia pallidilutea]
MGVSLAGQAFGSRFPLNAGELQQIPQSLTQMYIFALQVYFVKTMNFIFLNEPLSTNITKPCLACAV